MKKLKLICFVITLFGLTLNSSVWARGGHHRSHIGELVLGMAVGSVIRYGLGYEAHSRYNSYDSRYYLPHNAYQPVVRVPIMPRRYLIQ
jgi:hypothetical protein